MTDIKKLTDFLSIAEKLECEYRLTRMSDGKKQAVASHSWNMAMMAIVFHPYLIHSVNLERVLELCVLHDLPEAIAHDVPLHEQTDEIKRQKHTKEQSAIGTINALLQNEVVAKGFDEYELRQSPESKLVKLLDILDTLVQHMCAQDLSYVGTYKDNFYWRAFFSESFAAKFDYEPVLRDIYNEIRGRVAERLKQELNLDSTQFTKEGYNENI
ncbi:MAG: HD domain-containing protein [Alphaproteobacteria bacterium]|nr:HD domain-containing protein [Alphaproteobacteria bacterium]